MTKIGVAVTTYNRPGVLAKSLHGWAAHLGGVSDLVVIHDQQGAGVAMSKNRSLTALYDLGCDYLVLADDDVHPVVDGWWKPYVSSPFPSLAHNWGKSRFLEERDGHTYWRWSRGVVLVVTRAVVERVGGMRTDFGSLGGEHIEYQRRIHNCGLVPHPFMDVTAARRGVWSCEDYDRRVSSSMTAARYSTAGSQARHALYERFAGSTDYVAHRVSPGAHTLTG